jgi:tetratricopeptide (TPR) repeat protein
MRATIMLNALFTRSALAAALIALGTAHAVAAETPETLPRKETPRVLGPAPAPKVQVSRATPGVGPSPALRSAHATLQAGDYETASRLYGEVARNDPHNVDVLLGQAAIAIHRDDIDGARNAYLGALRLEPSNTVAQGALLALFGRADYETAELRLKELVAREPSAFLYQSLGTLYAEQGLWPQAQNAYFQAHRMEPRIPDHAYNLAVSLEHIGQRALAAMYYRRAVELARVRTTAAFDVAHAESRAAVITAAGRE